jgi:hypothetical protein
MDTYPLFAHTIASFHIDEPLDELLEFVDSQDSWVENTGEKVNRNYRSSTTHIFEHFPAIEKAVMSCVESYVNHVMFQPELRLQSTTSWMTKTKTGGYSKVHSHYNSLLSGVLHLEGSDSTDDGAFIVERPVMPTSFVLTAYSSSLVIFVTLSALTVRSMIVIRWLSTRIRLVRLASGIRLLISWTLGEFDGALRIS